MMQLHERVEHAKQLLDEAEEIRGDRQRRSTEGHRIIGLERQATAHATVALAEMLCQQSVCGHGVLVAHDNSGGSTTCLP